MCLPFQSLADRGERDPFDELHGIKPEITVGAGGKDFDDVRMVDAAQSLNFSVEASLGLRSHSGQHFERDLPPQRRLPRPVNDTHSALAQLGEQLKLTDGPLPGTRAWLLRNSRRILRRLVGPLPHLRLVDRHFEHAGQEFPLLASQIGALGVQSGRVAEIIGFFFSRPAAQKQDLLFFRLVHQERMERSQPVNRRSRSRQFENQTFAIGQAGRRRTGKFQRLESPGLFSYQLKTLDEPVPGGLTHVGDIEQSATRQKIDSPQHLGQAGKQGAGHFLIEFVGQLTGGRVREHLVAIGDEMVEQILQANGRLASLFAFAERFQQRGIETCRSRQIVARPAQ